MRSLIAFVVLALSACGNVASDGGAGGAGGRLEATGGAAGGSASASGTGGQASAGASGGNAATGGRGDGAGGNTATGGRGDAGGNTATGGRGDAGGGRGGAAAICIGGTSDVQGFAYNHGCDGGTTSPASCHANCELNSAHFVGCVNDSRVDGGIVTCHLSCAECP